MSAKDRPTISKTSKESVPHNHQGRGLAEYRRDINQPSSKGQARKSVRGRIGNKLAP